MRGDLLERCITLKLPLVTSKTRLTEQGVWDTFAALHPGLPWCPAGCGQHWVAESAEHHADGCAAHVRFLQVDRSL